MKRRHVLPALAAGLSPLALLGNTPPEESGADARHLIELRHYELKHGGNRSKAPLVRYLREDLAPFLSSLDCPAPLILEQVGGELPVQLWVVLSYPTADAYLLAQEPPRAAAYDDIAPDDAIYSRFTSYLLRGFAGLPAVAPVKDGNQLFELRTYEAYSEDAVRRKVSMFNREEIDLFYDTGLEPVFFGRQIAGPQRPALIYMLQFADLAAREENWAKVWPHPDWLAMKNRPEYANTVSKVIRVFLQPVT